MSIQNNLQSNKYYKWIYIIGMAIILALPLLDIPPLFSPGNWAKAIVFRIVFSILIFLFICQILFQNDRSKISAIVDFLRRRKNKIFWPFWLLVSLLGIYFLATIFSLDIQFSLWGNSYRSGGFVNFAFYIIFALLIFLTAKPKYWQKIWDFSIVIGALVSIIAVFQLYGLFGNILIAFSGRPPSTIGGSIFLGLYLLLLLFLTLSFSIKEKWLAKKILYSLTTLLFFYVILITGSRAAYGGLALGFLYFLLLYPKKMLWLKAIGAILLILGVLAVYYINQKPEQIPQFIKENKLFQTISPRLSISLFQDDPRFSSWQISEKAILERPVLGYGPENFSIAFDKYYDPNLPYINKAWGSWWDRAHNFVFDIAVTAGMPSLVIYLALFIILFWRLQKLKNPRQSAIVSENPIIYHGLQTTFIAYLTANFFSFDVFSTYLISFMLIGYSLFLIEENNISINPQNPYKSAPIKYKGFIIGILLVFLALFIWQYNIKPLLINRKMNIAENLMQNGKCEKALAKMEEILSKKSFLDAFIRLKYIDFLRACEQGNPEKTLEYAKKGAELLKENIKIQPYYTRNWLLLGELTNILIDKEKNTEKKSDLIKEADQYFERAYQLSPKRQEVFVGWAKTGLVSNQYEKMKEKSEKCIALNPETGECYWLLGLSQIALGNEKEGEELILLADKKRYETTSLNSLNQLTRIYQSTKNYKKAADYYQKLIKLDPLNYKYRVGLIDVYIELNEVKKIKEETLLLLKMNNLPQDIREKAKELLEYIKTNY